MDFGGEIMKILVMLSAFFCVGLAHANDDLELVMEKVAENFKVIATGLQTKSLGEKEVMASEDLVDRLTQAKGIMPDTATDDQLKALYVELMEEIIEKAIALKDEVFSFSNQGPRTLLWLSLCL
jgi:hypothetical protein